MIEQPLLPAFRMMAHLSSAQNIEAWACRAQGVHPHRPGPVQPWARI